MIKLILFLAIVLAGARLEASVIDNGTGSTYSAKNLTGNATTVVKTGPGVLHGVMINVNISGGTLTIYDGTSASGTLLGTINTGTPTGGLLSNTGNYSTIFVGPLDIAVVNGLTIVTAGSTSNNFTVIYQ